MPYYEKIVIWPETGVEVDGGEGEGGEGEDRLYGGHRVEGVTPLPDQKHLPHLGWGEIYLVKVNTQSHLEHLKKYQQNTSTPYKILNK